ncbi:hypothetical protein ACFLQR_03985 [Verrucomicrobiota bacterium]
MLTRIVFEVKMRISIIFSIIFLIFLTPVIYAADFTIDTTADFDAGVKTNIETITDYAGITADEIVLKLGDVYSDNFDGESEGTSPPTNWVKDTATPPPNLEIDDVHSHSSPHGMWMKSSAGNYDKAYHNEASGFTTDKVTEWIYFSATSDFLQLLTQKTAGDYVSTEVLVMVWFDTSGNIQYYDGIWNDTGYDYSAGWHKIEIVHDCPNDQFDMWYDDVQVINNGGFRNSGSIVKSIHIVSYNGKSTWLDDVKIGSYYTNGMWESAIQTMPAGERMAQTTIYHSGIDAANCIDKVEWLVGGQVKAVYETNITNAAWTAISPDMVTSGSFANVNADFQVKLYLVGDGSSTPVVTKVEGETAPPGAIITFF